MDSSGLQAACLLEELQANLPPVPQGDDGHIDTRRVLLRLAGVRPDLPSGRDREDLEALCREIAVRRRVLQTYDPGWRKGDRQAPLPAEWWPLLIAVLLAFADREWPTEEDDSGMALKSLNAALAAIDIAETLDDVAIRPDMRCWTEEILGTVSGGSGT